MCLQRHGQSEFQGQEVCNCAHTENGNVLFFMYKIALIFFSEILILFLKNYQYGAEGGKTSIYSQRSVSALSHLLILALKQQTYGKTQ